MRVKIYLYVIEKVLKYLMILVCIVCFKNSYAGDQIFFTPNRGQWDNRIQYQLEIPGGFLFLEKNAQTYSFIDRPHNHPGEPKIDEIKGHAFKSTFVNANPNPTFLEERQTSFYYNYFIGNNESTWRSNVFSYKKITYQNLYTGIDYVIHENSGELKSDYVVHKGIDPFQIQLHYTGVDRMHIEDGKLILKTSLATVQENVPVAYQYVEGKKIPVECSYVLNNNTVSFKLGKYNKDIDLIIDPVLYFSTYISSTADNFGCTATFDANKNLYAGSLIYAAGVYPTTLGAYSVSFGPGTTFQNMAITKFDASGSSLIYSTYLGGNNGTEVPHSLIVDANNNLFVFGTTGSSDYPTTAGAFDQTFNGGSSTAALTQGLNYPSGVDIVITKFNSTGTSLLGSTFFGGTDNDGINTSGILKYNYGDYIRGEIIIDNSGNPIFCSTTNSTNYPVTGSAPQTTYGGGVSDAVVTKLNANLTAMTWSTYYGGSADDAGYGIQPDLSGNLFFTGGTASINLPVVAGNYDLTANGLGDGFLAKINSTGTSIMAGTYVGTNQYDQSYLIQTDLSDNVYIFGQTKGAYPQTAGIYNNGNSGQFIHKFNNSLTSSIWSTRVGRNTSNVDISPTAFLVNDCYKIFICGWGGVVNAPMYGALASGGGTNGLPITAGSFQTTTDNSDFYLAIFSADMGALEYGTFFGGGLSFEHVDGGTARFDKDGFVYQAVCAGCGGHDDFPTTPGAWSADNQADCNLAVFKFNMETVVAHTTVSAASPICTIPYSYSFTNLSTLTNVFYWDFGDGTSDTTFNPTHYYLVPGTYTVMLVAIDTTTCGKNDTVYSTVFVPDPFVLPAIPDDTLCLGSTSNIDLTLPGVSYVWSPAGDVSNPTGSNVIITPTTTTTYSAIGTNLDGCIDTTSFTITLYQPTVADFTIDFDSCVMPAVMTFTNNSIGTDIYFWDFGDGFTSTLANPVHNYTAPGNYLLTLITYDTNACGFNDTIQKPVFIPTPLVISVTGTSQICLGSSSALQVIGGDTYSWSPSTGLDFTNVSNPNASPIVNTDYTVIATDTNGCKDTSTFPITVIQPPVAGFTPTFTPCYIPATVALTNSSTNSSTFIWMLDGITVNATDLTHVFDSAGTYTITLISVDTSGCGFNDTTSTTIFLPPPAHATAGGTDTICLGESLPVYSAGGSTYYWFPPEYFNDNTLQNPILTPPATGNYSVVVTDTNGCSDTAQVPVVIFPIPYLDAGIDLIYDFGSGPLFNPTMPTTGTYYWTPSTGLSCTDCLNPEATPEVTTEYYLYYTDNYGCLYIDSLQVMVTPTVYVPNAFTVNGDGTNEYFKPILRNVIDYKLYVFDRWGQLIFYTEDQEAVWDGTFKNVKCKEDVYVWKIKYISEIDPITIHEVLGHVTLLR